MNNYFKYCFPILFLFYSTEFIAQSISVNAGADQLICPSTSANLTMTYSPVKTTSSYVFSEIPYIPSSFVNGTNALATGVDDIYNLSSIINNLIVNKL